MKTEFSNFTVLVVNQSSISEVPLIVRCPRNQNTALMVDPLHFGYFLGSEPMCGLEAVEVGRNIMEALTGK